MTINAHHPNFDRMQRLSTHLNYMENAPAADNHQWDLYSEFRMTVPEFSMLQEAIIAIIHDLDTGEGILSQSDIGLENKQEKIEEYIETLRVHIWRLEHYPKLTEYNHIDEHLNENKLEKLKDVFAEVVRNLSNGEIKQGEEGLPPTARHATMIPPAGSPVDVFELADRSPYPKIDDLRTAHRYCHALRNGRFPDN